MTCVAYEPTRESHIRVKLSGKFVGEIRKSRCGTGFVYQPKNSRLTGEKFKTVSEVKASIEGQA